MNLARARKGLLTIVLLVALAAGGWAAPWSYGDLLLLSNLVEMGVRDAAHTARELAPKDRFYNYSRLYPDGTVGPSRPGEANAIVAPFTGNGEAMTAGAMLINYYLAVRWDGIDKDQRTAEMLTANLVEAAALYSWGQRWQLRYGFSW